MTLAEHVFLAIGLNQLAWRVVERHYANPDLHPGARDRSLARILERTGRISEAEEHYQQSIQPGEVDGHLFLGQFYERQRQVESAIRTYEKAVTSRAR